VKHVAIAVTGVLLFSLLAFGGITHGFTALTTESARRASVAARPLPLPWLRGIDQQGNRRTLWFPSDDRIVIVDFVFTRCTTICSALGDTYQQLQADIRRAHLENRVRLETISFDPTHDTPRVIAKYAVWLRADPRVWTLLTPIDPEELRTLLNDVGVVVKSLGDGQFIHNAALHVIDRKGRLARIVDITQPGQAVSVASELYDREQYP
jgi:protein SCO1/2